MLSRSQLKFAGEYLLKGVFLGWAFLLVVRAQTFADVLTAVGASLGTATVLLAVQIIKSRPKGQRFNLLPMLVLALLDSPMTVYLGILVGLLLGGLWTGWPALWIIGSALVGAVFGVLMFAVLGVRKGRLRVVSTVALLGTCGGGLALAWNYELLTWSGAPAIVSTGLLGCFVLFYLLTFAGRAEESELEIGLLCAGLALAMAQPELPPLMRGMVVIVPVGLFVVYCERIRTNLGVFKHVIRGISYEQQSKLRDALACYRRALNVNATSELAVAGNWRIHRKINLADLADDEEMIALIDPLVCLERARKLFDKQRAEPAELEEAGKLLDIVAYRRKDLPLTLGHLRLRALVAANELSDALSLLKTLLELDPLAIAALPDHEAEALFRIWMLALKDPRLIGVGSLSLIESDDSLFALLATLNRRLRQWSSDEDAVAFRPFVSAKVDFARYAGYVERFPGDTMEWFDFGYFREMALSLAEDVDQTEQAIDYLRIAEHGLPQQRLVLWSLLARLLERKGSAESVEWLHRIKQFARDIGVGNLSDAQRDAYFETVRKLAEMAQQAEDWDAAIENYLLYRESPKSGLATLRTLQSLYERQGDLVMAIRPVEAALTYGLDDAKRKQWQAEKARLYAAVDVQQVVSRLTRVEKFFDFGYCYRKAKSLFEQEAPPQEVIRYLDLAALGGNQQLLSVNYLLGRSYYRAGDVANAVLCLDAVKNNRPKRFADSEQEETYFAACRLLGDLALDTLGDPAKAVDCYLICKDHVKSGAETLFRLGRAYEANEQPAHARKWYDMVLVYPSHPRAEAAKAALARLKV